MPETFQLPEEVTGARQRAAELTGVAGQYQAAEPTISDVLRQKVQEAYGSSQDIIKPLDVATQNYLQAPQVAREQYQNVFNPFARERLVSQYLGTQALPMLSLSSILGQRFGRYEDLIGTGVNAYAAQRAAAVAEAEQARQMYEDLFAEYTGMEKLRQRERELDISEAKGAGGGEYDALANALLAIAFAQGGQGQVTTEPEPTETPSGQPYFKSGGDIGAYATLAPAEPENIGTTSPQGQWMWTNRGWEPSVAGLSGQTQTPMSLDDLERQFGL